MALALAPAAAARSLPQRRAQLMERPQFNRDIFGRGARSRSRSQAVAIHRDAARPAHRLWAQRQRTVLTNVHLKKRESGRWPRRAALERLIGETSDWTPLDKYLISYVVEPSWRRPYSPVVRHRARAGARRRRIHRNRLSRRSTCASVSAAPVRVVACKMREKLRETMRKTSRGAAVNAERGQETRDCAG